MRKLLQFGIWTAGFLAGVGGLQAQTVINITFDDILALSQPAEQYASQGIHFGSGSYGVIAGLSNGDPGGWTVDGTVGPYFLGFNGTPDYMASITIDNPVVSVSLDVSRTAGSSPTDTFTLTAFSGATAIGSQMVTLTTQNVWQTVTVTAGSPTITSIQLSGAGVGFHPFGVDNLTFTAVPEPSTFLLLGAGLGCFLWLRRRR